jgi:hypothetical protein
MLAKLKTFSLLGIDAVPVEVEVDVSPAGLPKTALVGLPEAAVKESTNRVERAIVNSALQRCANRVVVHLPRSTSPKSRGNRGIVRYTAWRVAGVSGHAARPGTGVAQMKEDG